MQPTSSEKNREPDFFGTSLSKSKIWGGFLKLNLQILTNFYCLIFLGI